MFVVLYRKALVALLINMPHSTGLVVSVVAHRVSAANPTHEATHLAIDQRSQDQMIVVRHQLVGKKLNFMNLQSFIQDSLKSSKVRFLFENVCAQVATIQSVIQPNCFVSAW